MNAQQEVVSENVVTWIIDALGNDAAGQREFADGLGKKLHCLAMDQMGAGEDLLRYVVHWATDLRFARDPVLMADVEGAEARISAGSVGEPTSGAELRDLLLR